MGDHHNKRLVGISAMLWLFQAIYTASPIDLIPDLIPVLGLMDDGAGWVITILFTIWAVRAMRKHGPAGIAKARDTIVDLERRGERYTPARPAVNPTDYEPMDADEILAL